MEPVKREVKGGKLIYRLVTTLGGTSPMLHKLSDIAGTRLDFSSLANSIRNPGKLSGDWYKERIAAVQADGIGMSDILADKDLFQFEELGPELTDYHHNAKGAIDKLKELKIGYAVGALHHP
ncbi:MAG: hypothetical protein JEZ06_00230 [Anaerolineaceae bacterium]|nr:hypothetical protein [Anaerolineaceae bacterium]